MHATIVFDESMCGHSYGSQDSPRMFTVILYCNPKWEASWGGELCVFLDGKDGSPRRVAPIGGRMVVFKSRDVWHEVLESNTERFAITLWVWQKEDVDLNLEETLSSSKGQQRNR